MRRRQRGQTIVIAAIAMTSMLGSLSLIIDAGVYFVLQKQLQTAADAAALAAVWYYPACSNKPEWVSAGCQTTPPSGTYPDCTGQNAGPCVAAHEQVEANQSAALSLCAGPNLPAGQIPVSVAAYPNRDPLWNPYGVTPYVVTVDCDAPHWFGRVLPNVQLMMHVSVSASAALGFLDSTGRLAGQPGTPAKLVARLLI